MRRRKKTELSTYFLHTYIQYISLLNTTTFTYFFTGPKLMCYFFQKTVKKSILQAVENTCGKVALVLHQVLTCCSTLQISIYRSFLLADDRDSRELCSFLNRRPKSVYCKLQRKSPLYIPFLGIARPQPQFQHLCVCERFI